MSDDLNKTFTQKAVADFTAIKQQQATHAASHPFTAFFAALGHVVGGTAIVAVGGVLLGKSVGPWYFGGGVLLLGIYICAPGTVGNAIKALIALARDAIAAKKTNDAPDFPPVPPPAPPLEKP